MHAQVFECYQYTCHIHMCMCMCMCICIHVYRKHGWMRIWTPQATHRILSVHQSYSYVHIHVYGKHAQMRIWTADTPLMCLLSQCISMLREKTWLNISGFTKLLKTISRYVEYQTNIRNSYKTTSTMISVDVHHFLQSRSPEVA